MPPRPTWHSRIDDIYAEIASSDTPMLDRAAIEKVFRIGRRQAIRLMHDLPGYKASRALMVYRDALLTWLHAQCNDQHESVELARKIQFADTFVAMTREARPRLVHLSKTAVSQDDRLPEGVSLTADDAQHNVLHIRYSSPKHLIERILMLTEAANSDYARFSEMVEVDRK